MSNPREHRHQRNNGFSDLMQATADDMRDLLRIEDKAGCGFIFTLKHHIVEDIIFMELGVSNELIHFNDFIDWSISKEQASQIARYAESPTCNDYLLEIGDTDEFGFWHLGKWYAGRELTYDFLAYDEIIFTVTVQLENEEFCNILTALGIREWDR